MPTNPVSAAAPAIAAPVVPTRDEVVESVARFDAAVRSKSWEAADTELSNLDDLFRRGGGTVLTAEDKVSVSLVAANAKQETEAANKWSWWQIVLSVFALGIPGLVDWWGKDNAHERADSRLKGYGERSTFTVIQGGPAGAEESEWLARGISPAGRGAKATSPVAKTMLAYDSDQAAQAINIAEYKAMPAADRALVFAHIAKAGADEQASFAARLWAAGFDSDDARFMLALRPEAAGETVDFVQFSALSTDAKRLIARHVARSEDHDVLRAFLGRMIEQPLAGSAVDAETRRLSGDASERARLFDTDTRVRLIEAFIDGATDKSDSMFIVALLSATSFIGSANGAERPLDENAMDLTVARDVFAHMTLDALEDLHDDVEGKAEASLLTIARRVVADPATSADVRLKLNRTILR